VLYALPISFSFILSPQYFMYSKTHKAAHYAVFSSFLSLHLSWIQIFSTAPCSQSLSASSHLLT
jgi:hypothetical protein